MALCVSSKFDSVQMTRTLQVDHVQFEIFSDLDFHGDAGTLVAEVSGYDDAILRCSVNGVFRNGKEVEQVAEREIPRLAEEAGATYDLCGDKYVFGTRKPGGDSSKDTVHFWYLGLGGHIAVVSVFVDHRCADDPTTTHVMECADLLVQTFARRRHVDSAPEISR